MEIDLRGHPLHTRLQTIAVRREAAGRVLLLGEHLDVRKRGFVPVGSGLQPSGIIHQMAIRGEIDPGEKRLCGLESSIVTPAFEASDLTFGESCRDVTGVHDELGVLALDGDAGRLVAGSMGRAKGCSHLLALTQLAVSALRTVLSQGDVIEDWGEGPARTLFHRSLSLDGAQRRDGVVEIGGQLSDLYFAPVSGVRNPMDYFSRQEELRLRVQVDLETVSLSEIEVAERQRDSANLGREWQLRSPDVAALQGRPFLGGFTKDVLEHFADPSTEPFLVDALLALPPVFIQICACFSETWPRLCAERDTLVGIGGMPDSCYMWRRGGGLHRRKRPTDPMGTL